MTKKEVEIPEEKLALCDKLIATNPKIERKGVTNPDTSHNGHVFTHLSKTGTMGLRLSKEDREVFLAKYDTTLYESYGAVMRDYVRIPDELLHNTEELEPYLELSYKLVQSLKPKLTRKKS